MGKEDGDEEEKEMKIKVKTSCPLCGNAAKCIGFHIKTGMFNNLTFWCRSCKLYFRTTAMHYVIENAVIEFMGIAMPNELKWENKKFNPSER